MNEDIQQAVSRCQKHRSKQPQELLKHHDVPNELWAKVKTDLFHLNGKEYLLVIDYYSHYPEVIMLTGTSSKQVLTHMKCLPGTEFQLLLCQTIVLS